MPTTRSNPAVTIDCPAKLNLTLAVGPARADGLHPIASVMVALDFADTLRLERIDSAPRFDRRFVGDAPKPQPIDWPIESDLAFRAHALVERELARPLPVHADLHKRIPAGAGLGGGSSDAAGMLVGLRVLFNLSIPDDKLIQMGQSLGADVGFLVHALLGRRAALVTGIGEVIQPLPKLPAFDLVLIFPDGACPTGAVYTEFDQQQQQATTNLATIQSHTDAWQILSIQPEPINDLTSAAIQVCPPIEQARTTMRALGQSAHLTGSGSALFVLAENQSQALELADQATTAGLSNRASRYDPDRSPPVIRL